ncbi:MAG: Gfo/Idh/MocA family oxidoreductase [Chitinophagaceae bacterium]|nr:Gfo/Idh/MocA family oxidoreductase [Chitinophagaceae bacterium]MEA3426343.1 putative oxidoreductase C-terminal domain-containing protein [Bacteroidota bacterium]MCA6453369.1 Gfo/Idh/MocA family oxidoreductase [Chitinophagaceae bacterium]MCA6456374.1 Gfo/Idh/MocA family oxidoreductase [Chitinophagaceae bacterium]MCA6457762.1 Gfo/Idh/MocA family oxidoreductase [Chitinophagaceae bacterium]
MRNFFLLLSGTLLAHGAFSQKNVKLITLDPGHFHAALVQKSMYPQVDPIVHVYARKGLDLQLHLDKIKGYNNSTTTPTNWVEKIYEGDDYLDRMLEEKKGNVVVLAGNNKLKTDYILKSVQAGFNVFSDKPMVINEKGFDQLKQAFSVAKKKDLLLYDIMTERYEITTILQKAFSREPALFGVLQKGTAAEPAVTKESVHHFYKYVSGSVLTRPAWFLDVEQEGEGIVDVTTHLVDLVQWECFPEQVLDYAKDVKVNTARSWATRISKDQFTELTKLKDVPDYLNKYADSKNDIQVLCNGEINYTLKGVHAKVSVIWNYKAPEGTGDTHYSIMRGTKANLVIRQGAEQQFKPTLYIEPLQNSAAYEKQAADVVNKIAQQYKGVSLKKNDKGWEVMIPDALKEGHEAHFARVTEKYLEYLYKRNMPAWEVPNMLAKYYTTTQAQKLASKK